MSNFFSIYQGDGVGGHIPKMEHEGQIRRMNTFNILFLLERGRSQTGGFFSNIYKKFKKTQEKDCRDWAKRQKQKGGRASFHDDIFS